MAEHVCADCGKKLTSCAWCAEVHMCDECRSKAEGEGPEA